MKTILAVVIVVASIAGASCKVGNCAPKNDDKVDLAECNSFPGRDNWFSCPEGNVTSIVHKEPDGVTEIVFVAEEGRIIWVHEKARIGANWMRYSINDDDQDDEIFVKTNNGIVTYMEAR